MDDDLSPDAREQQAKARFFMLIMLRFTGALLVIFGLLILGGRIEAVAYDSRKLIGSIVVMAGLVEALWIPIALERSWKSPDA